MRQLLFLHNSGDLKQIQMLALLAFEDREETDFSPWTDAPDVRDSMIASLRADSPVDDQIKERIETADAIVYCVGNMGQGAYQRSTESELVRNAIAVRQGTDAVPRIIPVLLNDGSAVDLPDWATRYTIVNHDRMLRRAPLLWEAIKQRLRDPPEKGAAKPPTISPDKEHIDRLTESLGSPPRLSVFVGPYALDDAIGPSALSEDLLQEIGVNLKATLPILPWPSEAAEWVMLSKSRQMIEKTLRQKLAPLGFNPPDVAHAIGFLAESWIKRHGERRTGQGASNSEDWDGLVLLTTRIDLALESALSRQSGISFTRIMPTLGNASESVDRRKMVQNWDPDPGWSPDPTPGLPSPHQDLALNEAQIGSFRLDDAKRVILVKLCGSLEVPASLILTVYDFFEKAASFGSLPPRLSELIPSSAQLLMGRGFASPLAQLVRVSILKKRQRHLPRLWVIPPQLVKSDRGFDALCDLELELLEQKEDPFREALGASHVFRGPEHEFLRRLAAEI